MPYLITCAYALQVAYIQSIERSNFSVLFASISAGTEGLARRVQAKWNQLKEIETKL